MTAAPSMAEVLADTLRRAAALMRERAEAATPGPWHVCESPDVEWDRVICNKDHDPIAAATDEWYEDDPAEPDALVDAAHIASWHPVVALAVADWLDHAAMSADLRRSPYVDDHLSHALKVARAYLGEVPDA